MWCGKAICRRLSLLKLRLKSMIRFILARGPVKNRLQVFPAGLLLFFSIFLIPFTKTLADPVTQGDKERYFSAVAGTASQPDTISWDAKRGGTIFRVELAGTDKDQFEIMSSGENHAVVVFNPSKGNVGIARAVLRAKSATGRTVHRSEEQTSELQSLMRNSYAVFCLK